MSSEKMLPAVTLAEAVARYCERGGNRDPDPKALEHFGHIDVATIDYPMLLEWAIELYPKRTIAERGEHFIEPLAEIIGLPPPKPQTPAWWVARSVRTSDAWWAARKLERDAAYEAELDRTYEWLNSAGVIYQDYLEAHNA